MIHFRHLGITQCFYNYIVEKSGDFFLDIKNIINIHMTSGFDK